MARTDGNYRSLKELGDDEKWQVLVEYLKNDLSNKQIGHIYGLSASQIDHMTSQLWTKFQNIKEAKMLAHARTPIGEVLARTYSSVDGINKSFLSKLSKEQELLTDNELLFCEFLLEFGDEVKAVEKSGLNVGLSTGDRASYKEGCRIRAMYLKKKENIKAYIYEMRKRNLEVLKSDGKEYIQSNLVQLIEQLSKRGDKGSLTSHLKAIEHLGRSIGAFEDRVSIETVNGDEVLDRIVAKAKEAQLAKKKPIQLEGGGELYE